MKKIKYLFQGDSITDGCRDKNDIHNLGGSYPKYAAAAIRKMYPDVEFEFINLGVWGNRTDDMLARTDSDIIDVQPDVVTFLLGVNDVWHRYSGVNNTDEMMEANYRAILTKVKEKTHAKIMIMQPYTVGDCQAHMRAEVERIHPIIKRLADEFADAYMPLDDILQAAENEPAYYAGDGVHPTNEGAAFIGENYVKYVKPILDELVGE